MATDLTVRRTVAPAWAGAITVVALQVAYPLTAGAARDALTVTIVAALAATCIVHAAVTRGRRIAGLLVLATAVPGFVAEVIGVRTGVPFGNYAYGDGLGLRLLGVPVVVAFAWTMLAWPAALAARTLVRGRVARIAVGAWALAAADLFLDPQMVTAGYWRWADIGAHLPGVPEVPLTNLAGWLLVATVLSSLVQPLVGEEPADDTVPLVLYLWLWAGWTVALLVFLDLPAAAAWGALGMGTVAVPLARRLR